MARPTKRGLEGENTVPVGAHPSPRDRSDQVSQWWWTVHYVINCLVHIESSSLSRYCVDMLTKVSCHFTRSITYVLRWILLVLLHIVTSCFRVLLFERGQVVADSGPIRDFSHKGGRLGVFSFSQEGVIWSNLVYRCNGKSAWQLYVARCNAAHVHQVRSISI